MRLLRCCYHQILGPHRHLPKLSNGLCRHAGACVRFNRIFAGKPPRAMSSAAMLLHLYRGMGSPCSFAFWGTADQVVNSRRLLLTSSARVTSGRGTVLSGVLTVAEPTENCGDLPSGKSYDARGRAAAVSTFVSRAVALNSFLNSYSDGAGRVL